MGDLLVFLALVGGIAVVVAFVGVIATVLLNKAVSLNAGTDAALPSHYTGKLTVSAERFPGHCPKCGTNNDPRSTICEECSARLPSAGRRRSRQGNRNTHLKE